MVFWRPLGTKEFDIGVSKSYDQSVLKHSCSHCFQGARSRPVVRKGPRSSYGFRVFRRPLNTAIGLPNEPGNLLNHLEFTQTSLEQKWVVSLAQGQELFPGQSSPPWCETHMP